jgi:glucose-6-phosphate-specific signal transduction histidine kinase
MTIPGDAKWPYRPALLLAAIALLLTMASMLTAAWIALLLLVAAVVFALVAVMHFWQKWRWQRANHRKGAV